MISTTHTGHNALLAAANRAAAASNTATTGPAAAATAPAASAGTIPTPTPGIAARKATPQHAAPHPAHPTGAKTAAASRTETTHLLRHEDINGANRLFGGRLMEWIDDAAGIAALRHCGCAVTTASVDTLQFKHPAYLNDIVVIVATVTYVGRCSLEVRVDSFVEDLATGTRTLINQAYLTEVCVDDTGRAAPVPYALTPTTDAERTEAEHALFRKEMRTARAASGV